MRISVAIDGPAGAGKSTIAKVIKRKRQLFSLKVQGEQAVL